MTERKVVWVTGAGSGMGRAAAVSAARAGWRIALTGRREQALIETAGSAGGGLVLPGDVTDAAFVASAAGSVVAEFGRLDALVLAAGSNTKRRFWPDLDLEAFDAIVDTNLTAVAHAVHAALPALRETHGTVVVISSYSGWSFSPGAGVAYSASKTALGALCRTLNAQEAGSGVRATHLCPGDVATDFLEQRPVVPDADARSRMLTPEDIGRAVQFVLDSPRHVRVDELVISPVSQA
ncbi:SDR family oxidoreductase [Gryllotalpicola ginsengisoli]|uniref:SDR family oxidoreductase n=1 Tax=Gryllotalpicola ginsengisoli TaxID=444608 RepID=UPI0003B53D36|nr:SDR family NAD(P)-dependent oxidoreductase [Gryllotalpicola ginsengisoli]